MFAIINVSQTNAIFRKSQIYSQRVTLANDEAFFIVTAEKSYGRVPWKKLESSMGILRKDVILAKGLEKPKCSISEFEPDVFPRILLINTAIDRLKAHKYKSLIIIDEKCIYMKYIRQLIDSFERIRVITPEAEKYEPIARALMETYGFSLEVSAEASYGGDVVISHRCDVPLYFSGLVFSNERKFLMNAQVITGGEIVLPQDYDKLRPDGIDPLLFASALYEKCNVTEFGSLKYI